MNQFDSVVGPFFCRSKQGQSGQVGFWSWDSIPSMRQAFQFWNPGCQACFFFFFQFSLDLHCRIFFVHVHCCLCRSSCNSCHLLLRVVRLHKIYCRSWALILRKGYKIFFSLLVPGTGFSRGLTEVSENEGEWNWESSVMVVCELLLVCVFFFFSPCNFVLLLVCLGNFWLCYQNQNDPKSFCALKAGLLKRLSQELPLEPCFCFR